MPAACGPFLSRAGEGQGWFVEGDRDTPTFLNGLNLAWIRYPDFVDGAAPTAAALPTVCGAEEAMRFLVSNGGNALRVWMLQEAGQSLTWRDGLVVGLAPGVLRLVQTLLEMAAHYGVRLVLVLFNGALLRGSEACSLLSDEVLPSLLSNAIAPLASALRGYESLAMWEVINGLVQGGEQGASREDDFGEAGRGAARRGATYDSSDEVQFP